VVHVRAIEFAEDVPLHLGELWSAGFWRS
jgi:hypothetical protein